MAQVAEKKKPDTMEEDLNDIAEKVQGLLTLCFTLLELYYDMNEELSSEKTKLIRKETMMERTAARYDARIADLESSIKQLQVEKMKANDEMLNLQISLN
mmetsp:Transcript_32654/g.49913  ORF Transcript_32654/g.49913 Transcript_32654/m.49913 type:complete len:100 (-) Transcript_32654:501-800(-)